MTTDRKATQVSMPPTFDDHLVVQVAPDRGGVMVTMGEKIFSTDHVRPTKTARLTLSRAKELYNDLADVIDALEDAL